MENEEVVPQGKTGGVLSSLTTKQKLIGGGLVVALGLGLYAARNQKPETQSSFAPSEDEELIPWMPDVPDYGGGSGSTVPPVNVPDVPPIIEVTPPVITAPEIIAPVSGPVFGKGGADYGSASAAVKAEMANDFTRLHNDATYRAGEEARAEQVRANRAAAGLDTSAQVKQLATIEAIDNGASFLNGGKTSTKTVVANGGANYTTADKATQQKLVSSEQLLKSGSKAELEKEAARVKAVIAQGGNTAAAQKHQARVNAALAAAK